MEIVNDYSNQNIIPHAGNLFFALRASGYDNLAAIADLLDNSIDAQANNVRLYTSDDLSKIVIADDGIGMSYSTLQEAVRLGGKKNHKNGSDLGKYGLGLITASLSIGKRIVIITKDQNTKQSFTAIFDYEEVQKKNAFIADFHESTAEERDIFRMRTSGASSGTVLTIDKCDGFQYKSGSDFTKALKDSIRTVFRVFMRNGKKIFVNDTQLNYNDPLWLDNKDTKVYLDKDIEVRDQNNEPANMHVLAVTVPNFDQKTNKELGFNIKNQGFYLMRNNREIQSGADYSVFKKHNDFNLLRIELSIDSRLDEVMNINFMKHDAKPNMSIIKVLVDELNDTLIEVRRVAKEKQQKKNDKPKSIRTIATGANNTSPILTGVTSKNVSTIQPVAPASQPEDQPALPIIDNPETETPAKEQTYSADGKIETRFSSPSDQLFSVSVINGKAKIWYNGQNPYYDEHIIKDYNGVNFKAELDAFIKATINSCATNNIPQSEMINIINCIAIGLEHKNDGESLS